MRLSKDKMKLDYSNLFRGGFRPFPDRDDIEVNAALYPLFNNGGILHDYNIVLWVRGEGKVGLSLEVGRLGDFKDILVKIADTASSVEEYCDRVNRIFEKVEAELSDKEERLSRTAGVLTE